MHAALPTTKTTTTAISTWESVIGIVVRAPILADSNIVSSHENVDSVNKYAEILDRPEHLIESIKHSVKSSLLTSLALNCKIVNFNLMNKVQVGMKGSVEIVSWLRGRAELKNVSIRQVHIELNTESLFDSHDESSNMSTPGATLLGIASEHDITTTEEATSFVQEISQIFTRIGINHGNMLQMDASISVHKSGTPLGTMCEVKNINSAQCLAGVIKYEIDRQTEVLQNGDDVVPEIRSWDKSSGKTKKLEHNMKDDLADSNLTLNQINEIVYNYLMDIDELRRSLPRLPKHDRSRLVENYDLSLKQACTIVNKPGFLELYESLMDESYRDSEKLCNFLLVEVQKLLKKDNITLPESKFKGKDLAHIFDLRQSGEITLEASQLVLKQASRGFSGLTVRRFINKKGWWRSKDESYIEMACNDIINTNANAIVVWGRARKMDNKEKAKKALTYLMRQVLIKYECRIRPKDMKPILIKRMQILNTDLSRYSNRKKDKYNVLNRGDRVV